MPGLNEDIPRWLQNAKEVRTPKSVKFSGNLPTWVQGKIFSSTPGIFDLEKGSVLNWMDGYAILCKFEIDSSSQSLTFSSRFLDSTAYKKAQKAQKPVLTEFGTPPGEDTSKGFLARLIPAFTPNDVSDNCIGSIVKLGRHMYVIADTANFHKIDPITLETLESLNTTKSYGLNALSPNTILDHNGDMYRIGAGIHPFFRYSISKMIPEDQQNNVDKQFETLCTIPSRWKFGCAGIRKSLALTENYLIFVEIPAVLSLVKLASTYLKGYRAIDWLDWRPEDGTRVYLVHKATGKVIKTEIYFEKALIVCSFVNAYEMDGQIILDMFILEDMAVNKASDLKWMRSNQVPENFVPGSFHRYVIPIVEDISTVPVGTSLLSSILANNLATARANRVKNRLILSPEHIRKQDTGFDFSVINPNFMGKKHSYVYANSTKMSMLVPSTIGRNIVKVDINTRQTTVWELSDAQQFPCRPVFLPNPNNSVDEDDGVLLSLIKNTSSHDQPDYLVVIDAKSMQEVARAEFDFSVPAWYEPTLFN